MNSREDVGKTVDSGKNGLDSEKTPKVLLGRKRIGKSFMEKSKGTRAEIIINLVGHER